MIMRVLGLILALLFVSMSLALAAEQPRYHVDVETGAVFAEFNGQTFEISGADWADIYLFKSIVLTADLDGDGRLDAVVSLDTGGNCCPSAYAVVTYHGGSFFAIATHPDFAAWHPPELVETPRGLVLSIQNKPDGWENTSLVENRMKFMLQDGQLREVSKLENAAMLFSPKTLTSKKLVESGKDQLSLSAWMDSDATDDTLSCRYWERWGALECTIKSSKFGVVAIDTGCDRIGILDSKTNGLSDLVCNRHSRLVFDGQEYVER